MFPGGVCGGNRQRLVQTSVSLAKDPSILLSGPLLGKPAVRSDISSGSWTCPGISIQCDVPDAALPGGNHRASLEGAQTTSTGSFQFWRSNSCILRLFLIVKLLSLSWRASLWRNFISITWTYNLPTLFPVAYLWPRTWRCGCSFLLVHSWMLQYTSEVQLEWWQKNIMMCK